MGKRKDKRRRKKTKFQKIARKNAESKKRDEESDASDPHQRSPEAVLFESSPTDLYSEKLSPEIIPKRSKIRLKAKACEDDAEVEDKAATRKIELSNPSSFKRRESDSKCDNKHDAESTSDFLHLENCPKRDIDRLIVDKMFDSTSYHSFGSLSLKKEQNSDESANDTLQNISQSTTFCSNLELQLPNNVHVFTGDVPEHANSNEIVRCGGRSSEERSQQEACYKSEIMNDCYSLNKTLSINDDLICQMNKYLEKQSLILTSHFTVKKSLSIADLQSKSFNELILAKSSVSEFVEGNDGLRDKLDQSKKHRSNNSKRFDAETSGEHLTTNWQFRKLFSYLWRITKKVRGPDTERPGAPFLAKYKKFMRWRPYTSITTLSSLSSVFTSPTPSSSKSNVNSDENSITYRSLLAKEDSGSYYDFSDQKTEYIDFEVQSGSTTSCSGSSPPAKRCRTILTFEDEKAGELRQPATRTEITDPFFKEGRKSGERSFPLDLPSCEETLRCNNCISELTFDFPDADPVPDYDNYENSLQQVMPSRIIIIILFFISSELFLF